MSKKKHSRSLRFILILLIFAIMLIAGVLSTASMFLLRQFGMISESLTTRLVITPLIFSLVLGTIISYCFSYFYVKPTKELISATKEVAKGNFDVRVDINNNSDTEFSELQKSFNKMAEELGGIEMFKNGFINDFSHEFKTPIVSIRGFAKQLKDESITEQQRNEYVDIIISESDRLANMATNILLLSKLENQTIIGYQSDFMLDEQIRQSILLLEKSWERKQIEFAIELDETEVKANAEMTSHIWINLISNAIKFSPEGGSIFVSCKAEDGLVKVSIKDEGIGMTQEELSRIFDKFYQADSSRKSDGNGLGLSIVRRVIDLYNGSIEVKSTPGKGSEFIVRLNCLKNKA